MITRCTPVTGIIINNTDGQKGGEGGRAGELVPLFRLAVFNPFKISMP